jgi:hypothetical protein
MIKQIDRVTGDLQKQVNEFKRRSHKAPICVAVVGINQARYTTGYEGERSYKTDGRVFKHPFQEAGAAERRLRERAQPAYDEFVVLKYRAINEAPFSFEWADFGETVRDYGATLARVSRAYEGTF